MELGEPDASGRRRPVPVTGSDFDLLCDRVILALGQAADLSLLPPDTSLSREKPAVEDADALPSAAWDRFVGFMDTEVGR